MVQATALVLDEVGEHVGLPDTAVGREGGADDVECPVGDLVEQARERRLPALGEAPAVDRVVVHPQDPEVAIGRDPIQQGGPQGAQRGVGVPERPQVAVDVGPADRTNPVLHSLNLLLPARRQVARDRQQAAVRLCHRLQPDHVPVQLPVPVGRANLQLHQQRERPSWIREAQVDEALVLTLGVDQALFGAALQLARDAAESRDALGIGMGEERPDDIGGEAAVGSREGADDLGELGLVAWLAQGVQDGVERIVGFGRQRQRTSGSGLSV